MARRIQPNNCSHKQQPDNNALLLPYWHVRSWKEIDGEIVFDAEHQSGPSPGDDCPICGSTKGLVGHGKRERQIRDAPIRGKPVRITLTETRVRCKTCQAMPRTMIADLDDDHRMTRRCVDFIKRESLRRPIAWLSREVGVDEKLIRKISSSHVEDLKQQNEGRPWTTRFLGIDDIFLQKRARSIFVDLETGRIIGLEKSHKQDEVEAFLSRIPDPSTVGLCNLRSGNSDLG